jgi:hypothetical protein
VVKNSGRGRWRPGGERIEATPADFKRLSQSLETKQLTVGESVDVIAYIMLRRCGENGAG